MTTTITAFGRTVQATTHTINTGTYKTSYRVWGTGPLRALFFHGGPGQAVVDYQDTNLDILDPAHFTVLEPDQLGTGNSQPSIRESILNAELYVNAKPYDIAAALGKVLDHLGWEKVYLHGGSWGSTLALLFAQMFPERVSGMVLRGIWLGSKDELEGFYNVDTLDHCPNGKIARAELTRYIRDKGFEGNPNSASEVIPFYRSLLLQGSVAARDIAAFNYWVHERFFMDECSPGFIQGGEEHYDQLVVDHPQELAEARSVAYWELTVTTCFFDPHTRWDLLGNINKIPSTVPVDIVHGNQDYLCPVKYAQLLETKLRENGNLVRTNYIDSGHQVTNQAIREGVKEAAARFAREHHF